MRLRHVPDHRRDAEDILRMIFADFAALDAA
jgi:hypothetical protein